MLLLKLSGVTTWFGAELVLDDVSLAIGAGERVGLVGENGVGKSTLLRIAAGVAEPDAGEVIRPRPIDVGYLPQDITPPPGQSVEALLRASIGRLDELAEEMRRLEERIAAVGEDDESALAAYGEVSARFEELGGYDADHRTAEVLDGLGLGRLERGRLVASLSGGQKMRLMLAGLLLRAPELLLLDEPTNHLDFAAFDWLETYLVGRSGGLLVVSHDRRFLNATARRIIEIAAHTRKTAEYVGDYDAYAAEKARERRRWEEEYERQQEEIGEIEKTIQTSVRQIGHGRPHRDGDKFAKGFFAGRAQWAISRNVRSAEERLRRIEDAALPKPPEQLQIDPAFAPDAVEAAVPLRAEGLRKAYGDTVVLGGVDLTLRPDSRIVLVGPNGSGKTTLLKILAGLATADAGAVVLAPGVRVGYLDQEQESLDPTATVLEVYREGLVGYEDELIGELVRYGLFTLEDVHRPLGKLSVGQKRKLQIARLVATRANILLLDEPTNHIHFDILEQLERALAAFPGPIVAVSHDRLFASRFGKESLELREGFLARHAPSLVVARRSS